jgi:IS1 family transposase
VVVCTLQTKETFCRQLWQAISERYKQGICLTDFWEAYQVVIPDEQHQAVGKETGLTAHVERLNDTIRQRLARFVRKTLSFSKSEHMHLICLHLFLVRYNLDNAKALRLVLALQYFMAVRVAGKHRLCFVCIKSCLGSDIKKVFMVTQVAPFSKVPTHERSGSLPLKLTGAGE